MFRMRYCEMIAWHAQPWVGRPEQDTIRDGLVTPTTSALYGQMKGAFVNVADSSI